MLLLFLPAFKDLCVVLKMKFWPINNNNEVTIQTQKYYFLPWLSKPAVLRGKHDLKNTVCRKVAGSAAYKKSICTVQYLFIQFIQSLNQTECLFSLFRHKNKLFWLQFILQNYRVRL